MRGRTVGRTDRPASTKRALVRTRATILGCRITFKNNQHTIAVRVICMCACVPVASSPVMFGGSLVRIIGLQVIIEKFTRARTQAA